MNKAGCLDRCDEGPVLVVYPDAVWYTYVDRADIDEIIDRHVLKRRDRREAPHLTPKTTERCTIDGPAGALEIALNVPAHAPRGIALVAHPHPLQGGTLDNKVAQTLAKTFFALGYAAVRFNFRGVGRSEGTFDDGAGETADALAALAHARTRFDLRRTRCRSCSPDSRSAPTCRRGSRSRSPPSGWCWSAPRCGASPSRPCPPTRSSSTARRTTSCRWPTCSRGRGRRSCRSSCSRVAAISSTAGCRSCSGRSPGCGTGIAVVPGA